MNRHQKNFKLRRARSDAYNSFLNKTKSQLIRE